MFQLLRNMGFRYVWFRLMYELRRRTGLLKAQFPTQPPHRSWFLLSEWRLSPVRFFFDALPNGQRQSCPSLQEQITQYRAGNLLFFSSKYYAVTDWLTNPANGYRYDATRHWTQIADLSPEAGDIKYVWEKSRFAFLYLLIRHDHWQDEDMAETVFAEIEHWIAANPINCGPNWRCSQEISLRVLNWTFALHYYKNSPAFTETRFERIMHLIYWQMRHVETNIDFSRIAVRNNHAITETLTLYLVGLLYPSFPDSARWKTRGKRWFEEEVAYQIYEDGTFLQFSMNYHRVVVQLLTWGLRLAHLNGERFAEVVYDRAKKSLEFLRACQDPHTGWLPNYGNNDGALFFPLSSAHFRDYRPQLAALEAVLTENSERRTDEQKHLEEQEDCFWYGLDNTKKTKSAIQHPLIQAFDRSGYYTFRDTDSLTFIRCGGYKDRPFQADNLHLDIWVNGENILRDAGSYLYNTDEKWTRYFAGTASHNTVMLGTHDQMRKGPRFIWYDWVREAKGEWSHLDSSCLGMTNEVIFDGSIRAFAHVGSHIIHRRRVTKVAGKLHWTVEDWLENAPPDLPIHQIWHPSDAFFADFTLTAFDHEGHELTVAVTEGWYSGLYGQKEPAKRLVFSTSSRYLKTEIKRV
ncbi:MAG: heparinase II/III family protein [Spirosomaceae bacterium]|nr:heparinase II/III family protein [Spirosomataceae bacterium]